jgi:hypothetical protein
LFITRTGHIAATRAGTVAVITTMAIGPTIIAVTIAEMTDVMGVGTTITMTVGMMAAIATSTMLARAITTIRIPVAMAVRAGSSHPLLKPTAVIHATAGTRRIQCRYKIKIRPGGKRRHQPPIAPEMATKVGHSPASKAAAKVAVRVVAEAVEAIKVAVVIRVADNTRRARNALVSGAFYRTGRAEGET